MSDLPAPHDPHMALEVKDLRRWYDLSPSWLERTIMRRGQRILKAVDGVSFTIKRGSTFAIVGESGCGKSTIARMIVGLERPSSGTIRFAAGGDEYGSLRTQMIFQDPYASLNPRWQVGDIVAEPIRALRLRRPGAPTQQRVATLMDLVGLSRSDLVRFPHQFSGGQRQRISIARALATEPEFLVLDEPTSALDVSVQAQVLNLMRDLQRELDLTYLFISHNLAVVRHMATTVAVMYLGRILEQAPSEQLFADPRHPYTHLLFDTVPDLMAPHRERQLVTSELPSPLDPPHGCAFHPRCTKVMPVCRTTVPVVRPLESGHDVVCHAE